MIGHVATAIREAEMSETERIVKLLGGKTVLGASPRTTLDLVRLIRKGIPYESAERTRKILGISSPEFGRVIGIPLRTLTRRKKAGQKVTPAESSNVYRVAKIIARAAEILGDEASAREWLHTPNGALAGERPMSLLDTAAGTDTVLTVLGRIEHGLVS
jgi:putative toxin-antitoxin system antitoxin component (TIGR02293 family)